MNDSPLKPLRLTSHAFNSEVHRMDADKEYLQTLLDELNQAAYKFGLKVQVIVHE